jgi:hypothetical protein
MSTFAALCDISENVSNEDVICTNEGPDRVNKFCKMYKPFFFSVNMPVIFNRLIHFQPKILRIRLKRKRCCAYLLLTLVK